MNRDYEEKDRDFEEEGRDVLQEMKEAYEHTPAPEEGRRLVEQAIQRAKKDKRRSQAVVRLRRTAVGIAAAFACIVALSNSSAQVAHAMGQIPILGAVVRAVTFRTYEADKENFQAQVEIPQLEAEEGAGELPQGAEEINSSIEEFTDRFIKEFESDMETGGEGYEGLDISYETVTDSDRLYTVKVWAVQTQASGAETVRYYTLDKATGEQLALADLFAEGSDYVTVLSEEIKLQMRRQMQEDPGKQYFLDDEEFPEWNFERIKEDQNFYITDGQKLAIVFDEYEVAPGYMGVVNFEIPTEEIADILQPDMGILQ